MTAALHDIFERTHARTEDPVTSKKAAKRAEPTARNRMGKLLHTFRTNLDDLTAREACVLTFGTDKGWQRVSDLKLGGFIEVIGERDGFSTFVLTVAGHRAWKALQ